jgi:ribosomal protein S18 acetylase RimI-like enzyme
MIYTIRPMHPHDYSLVRDLWEETEGLNLEESDSEEAFGIYLRRNRGLCFAAWAGKAIVGTVLCGHDGRRGILRHLAVKRSHRKAGMARALIKRSLAALAKSGIKKCNVFVLDTNLDGQRFWEHMGWHVLEDSYHTMQTETQEKEHANMLLQATAQKPRRS